MKLQIMQCLLGLKLAHGGALRLTPRKTMQKHVKNERMGLKTAAVDDISALGDVFLFKKNDLLYVLS